MALIRRDGGIHIRAVNFDVALGGEAMSDVLLRIALELHPQADDALLVSEKAVRLFLDKLFKRRGEVEMDTG